VKSFSSSGYVDHNNKHVVVYVHKTETGKFYCEIEYTKSSEIDSLDNFWDAVREIEEIRKNSN
jgi:hypothetical protein